jgi:ribosome maturation factor RimP
MNKLNHKLIALLEPVIVAMGYELWGIEQLTGGQGSLVRIYIDSGSGITMDDCERVSRQVTGVLDVNDPVKGSYNLEVSSPGMDRPLFKIEHFERFSGQQARIRLLGKIEGRKNITGRIAGVGDGTVFIQDEEASYTIPAGMIDKANLVHQSPIK